MIHRCLASLGALAAVILVVSLTSGPAASQAPPAAATTQSAAATTWTPPRTPWGEPDLQGVWRYEGATPLERPKGFAGREFLTDTEVTEREQAEREVVAKKLAGGEGVAVGRRPVTESPIVGNEYNSFWQETGRAKVPSKRTSLIVDPPDGQIPYTPAARKRQIEQDDIHDGRRYPTPFFYQSWLDLEAEENCLTHGLPGEMLRGTGGGGYPILQSPGYVVTIQEAINDRRIIPTDGRPHGNIRGWRGDAVGRWEGDTLVVETTNFADKSYYRWSAIWRLPTETLRLVERFRRTDADTLDYQFTVTDPATLTRPMTVVAPLTKLSVPWLEYACHEGNYGVPNTLTATRNEEKAAAEAAKKRPK